MLCDSLSCLSVQLFLYILNKIASQIKSWLSVSAIYINLLIVILIFEAKGVVLCRKTSAPTRYKFVQACEDVTCLNIVVIYLVALRIVSVDNSILLAAQLRSC